MPFVLKWVQNISSTKAKQLIEIEHTAKIMQEQKADAFNAKCGIINNIGFDCNE